MIPIRNTYKATKEAMIINVKNPAKNPFTLLAIFTLLFSERTFLKDKWLFCILPPIKLKMMIYIFN